MRFFALYQANVRRKTAQRSVCPVFIKQDTRGGTRVFLKAQTDFRQNALKGVCSDMKGEKHDYIGVHGTKLKERKMSHEDQQFIMAFYGALLSTGLLVWTITRDLRDRGRMKITGFVGTMVPGPKGNTVVPITITNVGSKTIIFEHIAGHINGKPNIVNRFLNWLREKVKMADKFFDLLKIKKGFEAVTLNPEFYQKPEGNVLKPYEYATFNANPQMFGKEITHFYVTDTSGNRHYMSNSTFKRIKNRLLEEAKKTDQK